MVDNQQKKMRVRLEPRSWSQEVEIAMAGATGNDPTYSLEDLKKEVRNGNAALYASILSLDADSVLLGYCVLWIDVTGTLREMVCQSGAILNGDAEAVALTMPVIEKMAKQRGCGFVRAHISERSWWRAFKKAGFRPAETVFRKEL